MSTIGVFDSGVGGISVLRALVKEMPNEDFLYYGDSANAPYGTKSLEEVIHLSKVNAEYLVNHGAKAIVIACNTATAAAVNVLREIYTDIPVIGIEPALKPAVERSPGGRVMVLATTMTVSEKKFKALMERYKNACEIIPISCPGLMEFVERGVTGGEELNTFLQELLAPYMDKKIDAAVLGCTHYPFVADALREVLGDDVYLCEGGPGTARETKRRLAEAGTLAPADRKGSVIIENSSTDPRLIRLSHELLEK